MKKVVVLFSVVLIGFTTSCVSNPKGETQRYEVYPVLRNGVIIMADKQTGELFRAKLSKEGNTTWKSLGSPADAQ